MLNPNSIKILYWPDGSWVESSEYHEVSYSFMGDDFGTVEVDTTMDDSDINRLVDSLVS